MAAATGFPLPYQRYTYASSFHYDFMPLAYSADLLLYAGVLFAALRLLGARRRRPQRVAAAAGLTLAIAWVGVFASLILSGWRQPVMSISDAYGGYTEYRPVGLSVGHGPGQCEPSAFWFDGTPWHDRQH